jgi:hypothetical protein
MSLAAGWPSPKNLLTACLQIPKNLNQWSILNRPLLKETLLPLCNNQTTKTTCNQMKNSITKTVVASATAISLAASAFAGETVHVSKNPAPPAPESFYNAHELQLGVSVLFAVRAGQRNNGFQGFGQGPLQGGGLGGNLGGGLPGTVRDNELWGADVDLTYFVTRNFGIGVEQQWADAGKPIWNSAVNFILRAPLHEGSRWAPYLFAGAGDVYASSQGRFEGHGGGGLEYRFTPKFGTFIDGRYVWVNGNNDATPQYGAFRAGVRFVF